MERAELAARLVEASEVERQALLQNHSACADVELAYVLKDVCLDAWSSDPARATNAAAALGMLTALTDDKEVSALASWSNGIAALIDGQMESAITQLETAERHFTSLNNPGTAAATQVSKLIALAMLGHYDEAIACGLRARDVLVAHGDKLAAGIVEQNLGNIYWRRDRYQEAENFHLAARDRFTLLNDQKRLAQVENCLANIHSSQHKFRAAGQLYNQALKRAEAIGLTVTQAEIECSIGDLALFQGHYDIALDYLERSHRKYSKLRMPHEAATVEQEIADAYLELNLIPEALAAYERIASLFYDLGMRAEQARALAQYGRAASLMGQIEKAHKLLNQARELYAAEENQVGAAMVTLSEAQLYYAERDYAAARQTAATTEAPFAFAGVWRHLLMARWLRGESARAEGDADEARAVLEATLADADQQAQPQIAHRCHTSLGLLAAKENEPARAEEYFKRAVAIIENLRAPLPAEEFRTSFFADKLPPYDELVRLCLDDVKGARLAEALGFVERARSRVLVETMGGAFALQTASRDSFEMETLAQLESLREELNWFYSQVNRPVSGDAAHRQTEMAMLQEAIRERENKTLELMRQLQHRGKITQPEESHFDLAQLQSTLGTDSALVEYANLDGELLAFVVTDDGIEVVRHLASEREIESALQQFHFQINSLRYGAARMRKHLPSLAKRAEHHLRALHDLLLQPIERLIGTRRLVIAPHRALHYVPFHALHDGEGYVIERREVCYTPSAGVLHRCFARPRHSLQRAVLLGVPDEATPRVRDEVRALAPLFNESVALLDEEATMEALQQYAPTADVLHLACHGQFRADNPLFSSLRLANGWLTVRDAYKLNLHCELVTLSACETGLSAVAAGDDLIGLARGFFAAGAPSLVLSLWTIDDEATAVLMKSFYTHLCAGDAPAKALRQAQIQQLREHPHPFFWSPFVLFGRW